MLLNLRYGKLKGLGEMMHTFNVSKDEVHLDIKRVGSAHFQHFCGACYFDDTFDAPVNVEPLCIGVALRVLFLLRFHRAICLLQFSFSSAPANFSFKGIIRYPLTTFEFPKSFCNSNLNCIVFLVLCFVTLFVEYFGVIKFLFLSEGVIIIRP